jgi:hypothetical protein
VPVNHKSCFLSYLYCDRAGVVPMLDSISVRWTSSRFPSPLCSRVETYLVIIFTSSPASRSRVYGITFKRRISQVGSLLVSQYTFR